MKRSQKIILKIIGAIIVILSLIVLFNSNVQAIEIAPIDRQNGNIQMTSSNAESTTNILFVGNSKTFYNNFPTIFYKLTQASGIDNVNFRLITKGGKTLEWNYNHNIKDNESLLNTRWDYVVLQENTRVALEQLDAESLQKLDKEDVKSLSEGSKHIINALKKKNPNIKIIYNAVWAYNNETIEKDQATVNNTYEKAQKETGGIISYSGDAFLKSKKTYPNISLYVKDNNHPTIEGSYLSACVLYATIYNQTPKGIKYYGKVDLSTDKHSQNWNKYGNEDLDKSVAEKLQSIAENVVAQHKITVIKLNTDKATIDLNGTKTVQLTSTVTPAIVNGGVDITWTSSNTKVATVDSTGKVTGKGNGTAVITATTMNDKKARCTVTVKTSVTGISLNTTKATIDLNETKILQLSSTITPRTANEGIKITWTSSNTKVATVDSTGKITGKGNGTAVITAKTENGKTATCTITVKTSVTEISLNITKATINLSGANKEVKLTSTITPNTANEGIKVTWTSSNTKVATVDSTGKVTGKENGTAVITAKTENGKTATCKVTVKTSAKGINLNTTETSIDLSGKSNEIKLSSTITPRTANEGAKVTWTSNNTEIATVDDTGKVTGKGNGTAIITAMIENGKTATCKVTVKTSAIGISLNKTEITMDLSGANNEVQLESTITPSTANEGIKVTWTSSNTNLATVDNTGKVTGKGNGTAIITATTENGKTATCTVTVMKTPNISSEKFIVQNECIKNIELGTNVEDFLKNIQFNSSSDEVAVYEGNNKVNKLSKLKTGMRLKVGNEEYAISIMGDADGDGELAEMDKKLLKSQLISIHELKNEYKNALDFNNDGEISAVDLSILYMLGA